MQFSLKQLLRAMFAVGVMLALWTYLPIDDIAARVFVFTTLVANLLAVAALLRSRAAVTLKLAAVAVIAAYIALVAMGSDWFIGLISYAFLLLSVPASLAGAWFGRGHWRAFSIGAGAAAILFAVGATYLGCELIAMDGEVPFQNVADLLVAPLALAPAVGAGVMLLYMSITFWMRHRSQADRRNAGR